MTANLIKNCASEEISPKRACHPESVIGIVLPEQDEIIVEPQLNDILIFILIL